MIAEALWFAGLCLFAGLLLGDSVGWRRAHRWSPLLRECEEQSVRLRLLGNKLDAQSAALDRESEWLRWAIDRLTPSNEVLLELARRYPPPDDLPEEGGPPF